MTNRFYLQLQTWWRVLTVVPGWADAPLHARIGRAAPVAFPVIAIVALMSWNFGYLSPRSDADHELLVPLLELESEISSLHMTTSQQQLSELAQHTAAASRLLVSKPSDISTLLQQEKETLKSMGWDTVFQIAEVPDDNPATDRLQISYHPVRAKMKVQASNHDPFGTLVAALEHLSSREKRIDLTRVAIRADESRWQTVEVNLRLIGPILDAKTPQ